VTPTPMPRRPVVPSSRRPVFRLPKSAPAPERPNLPVVHRSPTKMLVSRRPTSSRRPSVPSSRRPTTDVSTSVQASQPAQKWTPKSLQKCWCPVVPRRPGRLGRHGRPASLRPNQPRQYAPPAEKYTTATNLYLRDSAKKCWCPRRPPQILKFWDDGPVKVDDQISYKNAGVPASGRRPGRPSSVVPPPLKGWGRGTWCPGRDDEPTTINPMRRST